MWGLAKVLPTSLDDLYMLRAKCSTFLLVLCKKHERVLARALPQDSGTLLFVCQGNICRSPLAAWYVEAKLSEQGRKLRVCSAGLSTTTGKAAHPLAQVVAEQHGLSLNRHTTRPLDRALVQQASLIVVMESVQRCQVLRAYPESRDKVVQLGPLHSMLTSEIDDPYGGTLEDFQACFRIIRHACDNLLRRLDSV